MSVYGDLLQAVKCGHKFNIDFNKKSIKIGYGYRKITDVELINKSDLLSIGIKNESPFEIIEQLYEIYKNSTPAAKRLGNKPYFKAKTSDELTDDQIAFNISRDFAQACLEGYILLAGLNGDIHWKNEKYWFWQSNNDKELVVLKEWIE